MASHPGRQPPHVTAKSWRDRLLEILQPAGSRHVLQNLPSEQHWQFIRFLKAPYRQKKRVCFFCLSQCQRSLLSHTHHLRVIVLRGVVSSVHQGAQLIAWHGNLPKVQSGQPGNLSLAMRSELKSDSDLCHCADIQCVHHLKISGFSCTLAVLPILAKMNKGTGVLCIAKEPPSSYLQRESNERSLLKMAFSTRPKPPSPWQ